MATDLEKLVVQLSADFKAFEKGMARAQGVSNRQFGAIERRARQLDTRLNAIGRSAASGLIRPLSGLGAALGTREVARYADAWTEAGNKIRAAGQIAGVATRSLNGLKDLANETRSGFAETADLYAKLIRSASGVAKSEEEIATAVKVVNEAFKAGGASTSEQVNGIMQLSQALGSGLLQGDELRSIRENAPVLAQAIAKEFNTSIAGLKKLGAEGEITSARIFKAILAAQKDVGAAFAKTNSTIEDAITRVNNEFTAYIGNADQSAGATRNLVDALQFLADNFKGVADVVVQFATVVIAALTGRALLGMVAGLGNAVVALGAFLTALRAGTLAATGFTAALGPIGLLAGAAAAAIYLFYQATDSAESSTKSFERAMRSNEAAITNATDATYAQVDALRKLIAMQLEAARSAHALAQADFETALGRKDAFAAVTGGWRFAPFDYALDEADRRVAATGAAADKLEEQLGRVDKILAGKPSGYGGGSGAPPTDDKKGGGRRTADDRFFESLQAVRDRTAALKEEQALLGASFYEQQRRNVAFDLEREALKQVREEARRKGDRDWQNAQLTPQQVAAINEVSAAYAKQADELRRAQEAMDLQRDVMKGALSDLRGALADGKLEWEELAQIAINALDKIIDKIEDDLIDAIFQANNAGGGGGFLSGLFGLFGGGFSSGVMANMGTGTGLWAEGGYTGPGGKHQVAGFVHKGEVVWSQDDIRRAGGLGVVEAMRRGYADGGVVGMSAPVMPRLASGGDTKSAPQPVVIRVDVTGARGNTEIETMVQRGVQQGLRAYDRALPDRVQQISNDPRRR